MVKVNLRGARRPELEAFDKVAVLAVQGHVGVGVGDCGWGW